MSIFHILSCKSQEFQIPARYEAVKPFHGGIAAVKQQGLWGFIDNNNTMIIPPQFSDILYSTETGTRVILPDGSKKQLILMDIDPGYSLSDIEEIKEFKTTNGPLRLIQENQLLGLQTLDGKKILLPQFDAITYIGSDLFVCEEYGEGDFLINDKGNMLFHEILGEIVPEINRGRIQYRGNDKSGMIDEKGNILIPKKYWRFQFAGNCIACTEGGKLGLVNNKDIPISENIYDEIFTLSENTFLAVTTDNGLSTIYNSEGVSIVKDIFTGDGKIQSGLLPVKNNNNLYGYVDANGEVKIPYQYYYASSFFENGTAVIGEHKDNKYSTGLINLTGKNILPADYQQIFYKQGVYTVIQNDEFQLLNEELKPITEFSKDAIEYLGNNIYAVYKLKTKIEYNNPSIWFGSKGGLNLYKEGILKGIYDLKGNKLIDGEDYNEIEELPVCSEGMIAVKQNGNWGFMTCSD